MPYRLAQLRVSQEIARIEALRTSEAEVLETLRRAALRNRLSPRRDPLESACDILRLALESDDRIAEALVAALPTALGRKVLFRRPDATEMTFDEAWLLRLLSSTRDNDRDSLRFVISSRVQRSLRAGLRGLAMEFVRRLDAAE